MGPAHQENGDSTRLRLPLENRISVGDGAFAFFKRHLGLQRQLVCRLGRTRLQRAPAIGKRRPPIPRETVRNLRCRATAFDGVDGDEDWIWHALEIKLAPSQRPYCIVSY